MASVNDHENRIKKVEDRHKTIPLDAFSFNVNSEGNLILNYNTEFVPNFKIKDGNLYYTFDNTGEVNLGKVTQDLKPVNDMINANKSLIDYINSQLINMVETKKVIFNSKIGNGTITLNESYRNFDYIEILYTLDNESIYGNHRIPVDYIDKARAANKPYELTASYHVKWAVNIASDTSWTSAGENSVIIEIRGVKMPRFTPRSVVM